MDLMISTKAFGGQAETADEAKKLLVLANRILANEGVIDAYGHVSIRNPENRATFFISRAISPEFVTPEDILELDLEGNVVGGDLTFKPYGERVIHSAIYRLRPDVNAVAHAHPPEIMPYTACDIPLRSINASNCTFYEGIPVYGEMPPEVGLMIATPEEGEKLARTLGDKRGVLIRNHGVAVVGECIQRMVYSIITLRDGARMLTDALSLGAPVHYLGYEEAKKCTEIQFGEVGLARGWNYWVRKVKTAFSDLGDMI